MFSFSVDRDGFIRSIVLTASLSAFCATNFYKHVSKETHNIFHVGKYIFSRNKQKIGLVSRTLGSLGLLKPCMEMIYKIVLMINILKKKID